VGSPAALVALRALDGVGSALRGPATTAYIGDAVSEARRGRPLGAHQALGRLGVVLGPALGGLLTIGDPGLPFLVLGAPTALAGPGLLALPAVSREESADEDDDAWWTLGADLPPVVALLAVASLLAGVSGGAFGPLFALHLESVLGVPRRRLGRLRRGAARRDATRWDARRRTRPGPRRVAGQLGWLVAYAALAALAAGHAILIGVGVRVVDGSLW
jgi:MFS family permease